jgi:hypothetical protein
MRLWRHHLQNWIGDWVLAVGVACVVIPTILLASQIIIDVTHNH